MKKPIFRSQFQDVATPCTCQLYQTCKWGNETLFELTELLEAKSSTEFRKVELAKFFTKRICEPKTRSVYCCRGQRPPLEKELIALRENELNQKVIIMDTVVIKILHSVTK